MSKQERMIASGYEFAVHQAMEWSYDREEVRFWMGMIVGLGKWAKAVPEDRVTADMNRVRAEIARHALPKIAA